MFEKLSNLGALIRHAQRIGGQMKQLTEKLKERRVVGASGGGMVEIEVNGLMEVLRCSIDQQLVDQRDGELLEDLVAAAVEQAIVKGKQLHADMMQEITGGMEIPGVQEALARFIGANTSDQPEEPSGASDSG
jgi:DNA-binding YbaB/EbfC family protein